MSHPNGTRLARRISRRGVVVSALILGAAVAAYAALRPEAPAPEATGSAAAAGPGKIRWTVERGDLTISALAPGELKTRNTTSIENAVERSTKLVWIVEEGSLVRRGDKLVELDAAEINEALLKQRVRMADVEQNVQKAQDDLAIGENKAKTDMVAAENALKIAELDLKKFKEGEYLQDKRRKESAVALAEEDLKRARSRLEWTQKLVERGFETQSTLEADEFAVKNTTIKLESARQDLELLEKFTYERETTRLTTALVEAEGRLEQTRLAGQRDLATRKASLAAAKATLELETIQLRNLEHQLERCVINAPEDGMVVYVKDRWRSNEPTFQIGSPINSRQKLIELPDFGSWKAECRVHESLIQKIRPGQKAFVSLDALPGVLLEGVVGKISVLPDNSNWLRTTQEYIVELHIDEKLPNFKPGMSAKTEIVLAQLDDVVFVPIQAVDVEQGKTRVWVQGEIGPVAREVEVGENNDRFVEIRSGLTEGEVVLLDKAVGAGGGSGLGPRPAEQATSERRSAAGEAAEKAESAPAPAAAAPRAKKEGKAESEAGSSGVDVPAAGGGERAGRRRRENPAGAAATAGDPSS